MESIARSQAGLVSTLYLLFLSRYISYLIIIRVDGSLLSYFLLKNADSLTHRANKAFTKVDFEGSRKLEFSGY